MKSQVWAVMSHNKPKQPTSSASTAARPRRNWKPLANETPQRQQLKRLEVLF